MAIGRYGLVVVLGVAIGSLAHAGVTTSSTTSTSTSSSSSTTTTTVSACVDEVSLASAQCRTLLLVGILQQRGTAPGNTVLTKQMNRVQKNLTAAAGLTGHKARSAYKRAASALKSFNVRLRSATGKRQVDQATRDQLQTISKPLETTVKDLARQAV